jgi:alkylhydroperoxidase family enzyme
MARLRQVTRAEASPEIRELYDQWFGPGTDPVATPGTATGTPGDWWTVHALVPEILSAIRSYSYTHADVDPALRELALMRAGYVRESRFVYSQHCKAARKVGVPEAKIAAIPYWQVAALYTDEERAVLAYVDGLILQGGRVHDAVFEVLKQTLDDRKILILHFLVSMYAMHSATCRALKLEYDNVPDRIVEIPVPDKGGVQDWVREHGTESMASNE